MTWLKKYWWVVLLAVVVVVVVWMYYKKQNGGNGSGTCNNTKAEWDAKIKKQIEEIKNNDEWLALAQATADKKSISLEDALEEHASYHLRTAKKECNPYWQ